VNRVAVYPGTFDPVTNGHLDIIKRALEIFDEVIVGVAVSAKKQPVFDVSDRVRFIRESVKGLDRVRVESFDCLLVDFVLSRGAQVILKGLRAVSDYEHELQMASMNRRLSNSVETVFLMAGEEFSFLSSSLVKEVFQLKGNVNGLVTPVVEQGLREKFFTPKS
jgi:pantetheine-phosphate adenylyltransferase